MIDLEDVHDLLLKQMAKTVIFYVLVIMLNLSYDCLIDGCADRPNDNWTQLAELNMHM